MPRIPVCLAFFFVLTSTSALAIGETPPAKPNVVIILADDLGFSDLGCYGGEIATPNLDALASNGLRFTQFYNTGRCWPTRASLLTGYYAQQVRRDRLPNVRPSGGAGTRPKWAPLLPVRLRQAGYRSYHTGKWHLDGMPVKEGFDRSYYLEDQARFFSPKKIHLDDVKQPAIKRGTDYYATTDIANQAIRLLKDHAVNHAETPFFHFIAFTAPHFPLHALPEDIEKYKDKYLEDWEAVRFKRWQRIQSEGIVGGKLSDVERSTGAPYSRPQDIETYGPGEVTLPLPWDTLTKEQKRFQATKMAIHAAMVDRMDQEIGRVLNQLRSMDQFENTLILFLSDNGCSAELMIRNDGHDPDAAMGSADTHLCLGPGWSTTCNTPFRKHKTWVHEGGISTPLIAHWPQGIEQSGELRSTPGHIVDILPTVAKLAGFEAKTLTDGPQFPGKSLIQVLQNDTPVQRDLLWWSHENHRAIRVENWKAVKTSKTAWELFNLAADRTETNDLAAKHPQRLAKLKSLWKETEDGFIEKAKEDLPKPRKVRPKKAG